jgi:phosphoserine phosphatase
MVRGPWRLVTFDIDGTLTLGHGWRLFAEQFGRTEAYERTMARIRARRATEDETLTALLQINEGRTLAEVEAVIAATPKLAGIPAGVRRLKAEGLQVALLTHNPPYITAWYRTWAGFEDAGGIRGHQATDPRLGPPQEIRADKRGGLRDLVARRGVPAASIVHVGDSRPDAEIFPLVGAGVALNAQYPEVERAADLAIRTSDFSEVVEGILALPARRER